MRVRSCEEVEEKNKYDQNLMYKILKQLIIHRHHQKNEYFLMKTFIKLKIIITIIKI